MPIPDDVQARLAELADQFVDAKAEVTKAEARVAAISAEIRKITNAYTLPVASGKSEYVPLPARNMSLRVTRAAEPPPVLKLGQFLRQIPYVVVERVIGAWLEEATVPDSGFDMKEWELCVTEELVTANDLVGCIGTSTRKKPVDSLTAVKGTKVSEDDSSEYD